MKRLHALVLLSLMTGCASQANSCKHQESDMWGLDRTITLYGSDGTVIREWKTKAKVEDQGGTCWFLDKDGKAVLISGTFIIEEN